ncbi:MAG: hypothetical protein J2P39_08600, partial [Candidatus Dormibacteraeota bacterium]|nr:hypothetical protein [Candidatus Dormibacteraeota bacterium]
MPASRSFLTAFPFALVLPVLLVTSRPGLAAGPSRSATPLPGVQSALQQATFTVDAVPVTATTRFLPSTRFVLPKRGDLTQTASSSTLSPFSELSLTAIPYGTKPSTEWLPEASQGAAAQYRAQLQTVRRQEGAQIFPGPVATLFGTATASQMVVSSADLGGGVSKPLVAVEWVAEAGGRLWIARAAANVAEAQQPAFASAV